jgi:hypothetical protein
MIWRSALQGASILAFDPAWIRWNPLGEEETMESGAPLNSDRRELRSEYEPPRVEQVLSVADLDAEIMFAGPGIVTFTPV